MEKKKYWDDFRFAGIVPFENKVWLSSPTMHGEEQFFVDEAIRTNWVSTVGANINAVEELTAAKIGCKYAVALSSGQQLCIWPSNYVGKNCTVNQNPDTEHWKAARYSARI